jgi:methylated-DNA-protein-cysteine methyltransferase-like protein
MRDLEELWGIVRSIPAGKCAGYGSVAHELENPVSGYTVGRWMAGAPAGVPWWRVVSKDGSLAIAKRDPAMAVEQKNLLRREGVAFEGDRVRMDVHGHDFDLPDLPIAEVKENR